jgi:predicted membrane-bound mannosyltransferase
MPVTGDRPSPRPTSPTGTDRSTGINPTARDRGDMGAIALRLDLSVEKALWLALFLLAALTRLWDLGYRTQHHDESIHTTFSWKFATGETPYVHNPLSHGPFLFHANALIYDLFGANDATSRLLPAITGIAIVMTPWLLRDRRLLGRWGALAAGTFLLFSPSFLYYTRFIRHDPYTALGALLLVVAIFRYLLAPHRKWILLAFIDVAFLLSNHEIVFAILLAFVIVLWGALVLSRLRVLIPVHLGAAALLFLLLAANSFLDWGPLPTIPWQTGAASAQREYYGELLTHPLVIGVLLIGIAFIIGCVLALRRASRGVFGGLHTILGDAPRGSVARGVYDAWLNIAAVGLGALLALWIFLALFTTLFTNLNGIATGTYATNGTLLYWLGQHDVRRGEQPWFYFITEGLQYEWLVIFLGLAGLVTLAVAIVRRLVRRDFHHDPRLLFRILVAFWMVFMFVVLSWAGEKMPWLIMHIVLPAALLGGLVIDDLAVAIGRWYRRRGTVSWRAPAALGGALVVLAGSFFFIAANLTWGGFGANLDAAERSVRPEALDDWWLLAIPPLASLVVIGAIWLLRGARPAIYGTIGGLLAIMLLFQIHAGFRLTFIDGDVSVDTMIYNTVSPDAKQVAEDIHATSELYLGDDSITVSNDQCTNWPMEWYLKDLPNYRFMRTVDEASGDLPMFIIGVPSSFTGDPCVTSFPDEIPGYVSQTYVFRWHEPESQIYRKGAIAPEIPMGRSARVSESQDTGPIAILGSIWDSVTGATDPDEQQKLWRLLMYRELPGPMIEFRFKIFVNEKVLPYYNDVRYGQ